MRKLFLVLALPLALALFVSAPAVLGLAGGRSGSTAHGDRADRVSSRRPRGIATTKVRRGPAVQRLPVRDQVHRDVLLFGLGARGFFPAWWETPSSHGYDDPSGADSGLVSAAGPPAAAQPASPPPQGNFERPPDVYPPSVDYPPSVNYPTPPLVQPEGGSELRAPTPPENPTSSNSEE